MFRTLLILGIACICIGCEPSNKQKVYDLALERVRGSIYIYQDLKKGDDPDARLKLVKEFLLPSEQAALALLKSAGADRLQQPLVRWGVIYIPKANRNVDRYRYSHFITINWFELGTQVTGFYLQMKDGEIYEFKNTIETEGNPQTLLTDPGRLHPVFFTHENPKETWYIKWPPNLYKQLIVEHKADKIGLILKDGTKTKPGPLGYHPDVFAKIEKGKKALGKSAGVNSLQQPLVRWGAIYLNPVLEAKRGTKNRHTHSILISWLEWDTQVTGFYLQVKDGEIYEFKNTIETEGNPQTLLTDPGPRLSQVFFTNENPKETWYIKWTPNLYKQLIVEHKADKIGLILKDGTKTKPGPFGYSDALAKIEMGKKALGKTEQTQVGKNIPEIEKPSKPVEK